MPRTRRALNPFYPILVVMGVLFSITALAYGVMSTVALNRPEIAFASDRTPNSWFLLIDQHGFSLMMIELAVLFAATVLAISTDDYWASRSAALSDDLDEHQENEMESKKYES